MTTQHTPLQALIEICSRIDELETADHSPVSFVEVRALQEEAMAAIAHAQPIGGNELLDALLAQSTGTIEGVACFCTVALRDREERAGRALVHQPACVKARAAIAKAQGDVKP